MTAPTIHTNILRAALLFAGKNDVRYYLNRVYLTPDAVYATDGHRLIKVLTPTGVGEPVIIERSFVEMVVARHKKEVSITQVADRVVIGDVHCKLVEGKYPDVEQVLSQGSDRGWDAAAPTLSCDWSYLADCEKAAKLVAAALNIKAGCQCYYDLPTSRVVPDPKLRGHLAMMVMRRAVD